LKNVKIRIYKTIILPVVLYGCETWSLTLREEDKLNIFENRMLRGIFGLKRNEVIGWKNCITRSCVLCIIRIIKLRRNEVGGACNANGGSKRNV
jgi:hypothetical protein